MFKKNVYLLTKYKKYGLVWQQHLCPRKVLSKGRNVIKNYFWT